MNSFKIKMHAAMATDQNAEAATDIIHADKAPTGCHSNQVGVGRNRDEGDGVCAVRGHSYCRVAPFSHCVCVCVCVLVGAREIQLVISSQLTSRGIPHHPPSNGTFSVGSPLMKGH